MRHLVLAAVLFLGVIGAANAQTTGAGGTCDSTWSCALPIPPSPQPPQPTTCAAMQLPTDPQGWPIWANSYYTGLGCSSGTNTSLPVSPNGTVFNLCSMGTYGGGCGSGYSWTIQCEGGTWTYTSSGSWGPGPCD